MPATMPTREEIRHLHDGGAVTFRSSLPEVDTGAPIVLPEPEPEVIYGDNSADSDYIIEIPATLDDLGEVDAEPVVGTVQMVHLIAGIPFDVENEDDLVYLRHPTWSLVGQGDSLGEAVHDLYAEAREVAAVLAKMSPTEFGPDLLDMYRFLSEIV